MNDRTDESTSHFAGLSERAVIGLALAEAFREPRTASGACVSFTSEHLAGLRQAWDALAGRVANHPMSELSLGELAVDRASTEPLTVWLSTNPEHRSVVLEAVFGLVISKDCPPYETEFCHWNDPTYRSSQMADIGGFYRAFGVQPSRERPERHDHIAFELDFIALLQRKLALALECAEIEHIAICRAALTAFVRDHAAWWIPTFAGCLKRRVARLRPARECERWGESLDALDGVADLLRAWIAVVRIESDVEVTREIIAPHVPNWSVETEGEECGACDEAAVCSASGDEPC